MSARNRYRVAITLEVHAEDSQLAIECARDAGRTLKSEEIPHAWIDVEATPLFDDSAFRQIRGQLGMSS